MGFLNVLLNAGLLIAFCVPGFFLRKFKFFDNKSVKALVVLLIFVAQPAMVAKSVLNQKFSSKLGINMLIALGIYCAVLFIIYFASCCIFRIKKQKRQLLGLADISSVQFYKCGDLHSVYNPLQNQPKQEQNENQSYPQNNAFLPGRNDAQIQILGEQCQYAPAQQSFQALQNDNSNLSSESQSELPSGKNTKLRLEKDIENNRLYRFACAFGNNGYFGLPLIMVLFPGNDTMLLYASLCVILFNILVWTVGVFILTSDKKYISIKKGILAPVPIVAAITLPFFFIKAITIPQPILSFLGSLGNMTTPLSMIIMGARLAEIPIKEIFSDWKIYIVAALRLLVAPAVAYGALKLFGITDPDLFNTLMIVSLVPSAVTTIVLAEKYLKDSYTAVKAVLLTTIFCIITIPLLGAFVLL